MASIIHKGFVPLPVSQPDSSSIFLSELLLINSTCTFNTILCVGSSKNRSNVMSKISCGNCWSILRFTNTDGPSFVNGAYWFMNLNETFGFSSILNINQNECTYVQINEILCWILIDDTVIFKKKKSFKLPRSMALDYMKHIFILNASDFVTNDLIDSTVSFTYPTQSNQITTQSSPTKSRPILTRSSSSVTSTSSFQKTSNSFTTFIFFENNNTYSSAFMINSSSISTDGMTEQSTASSYVNESNITVTTQMQLSTSTTRQIICLKITEPTLTGKQIASWYICYPLDMRFCTIMVF